MASPSPYAGSISGLVQHYLQTISANHQLKNDRLKVHFLYVLFRYKMCLAIAGTCQVHERLTNDPRKRAENWLQSIFNLFFVDSIELKNSVGIWVLRCVQIHFGCYGLNEIRKFVNLCRFSFMRKILNRSLICAIGGSVNGMQFTSIILYWPQVRRFILFAWRDHVKKVCIHDWREAEWCRFSVSRE